MTLQSVQGSPMKVMGSVPKTITLTPAQMVSVCQYFNVFHVVCCMTIKSINAC